MTKQQIKQAFEGRWRIKSQRLDEALEMMLIEYRLDYVKKLCRDFFETGIMLASKDIPPKPVSQPLTPEECVNLSQEEQEYINDALARGSTIRESDMLTVDDIFNTWWDLYDKKIDRAKCFSKWKKLTDDERRACIAATPAYVASTPDLQYRRHPATYLNNKSWENQIIPRNNGNSNNTNDPREKLADVLAP